MEVMSSRRFSGQYFGLFFLQVLGILLTSTYWVALLCSPIFCEKLFPLGSISNGSGIPFIGDFGLVTLMAYGLSFLLASVGLEMSWVRYLIRKCGVELLSIGNLFLVLAASYVFQKSDLVLALIILAGFAAKDVFFAALKRSMWTSVVESDRRLESHAVLFLGSTLASGMGLVLGVLLGFHALKLMIALAFLGVAAGFFLFPNRYEKPASYGNSSGGSWTRVGLSLRATWELESRFLAVVGLAWCILIMVALIFLSLSWPLDPQVHELGFRVSHLAILAVFIGLAAGSLLYVKPLKGPVELGWVPLVSVTISMLTGALGAMGPVLGLRPHDGGLLGAFLFCQAFLGMGLSIVYLVLGTFVDRRTPPGSYERIALGTLIWGALFGVLPVGLLGMGLWWGITVSQYLWSFAFLNLVISIGAYQKLPEFTLRLFVILVCRLCYHFRVTGGEHIPREGACLVVSNHVTLVDWLFIASGTGRPVRFVMLNSYYRMPIVHYLFRDGGAIPIGSAKTQPKLVEEAFEAIHKAFAQEEMVILFPEGKLTTTGKIDTFKRGVEKVLARDPIPVLPVALRGLWGTRFSMSPKRRWHFRPPVEMVVGPRRPGSGQSAEGLHRVILDLFEESEPI